MAIDLNGIPSQEGDGGYIPPPAVITVLPTAPWITQENMTESAPYDTREYVTFTTHDPGVVQMPGTGVGDDGVVAAIVSVSGGMTQLALAWVVGRSGAPPQLPAFFSKDTNIIPLEAYIVTNQVTPNAVGSSLVYQTSGYYRYAVVDIRKFQIVAPTAPFMAQQVKDGARLADGFWTESVLNTNQAVGCNPFIENGYNLGEVNYPEGFDGEYSNDTVTSQGEQPPPSSPGQANQNQQLLGGLGGTGQSNNNLDAGEFNLPQPPVNP